MSGRRGRRPLTWLTWLKIICIYIEYFGYETSNKITIIAGLDQSAASIIIHLGNGWMVFSLVGSSSLLLNITWLTWIRKLISWYHKHIVKKLPALQGLILKTACWPFLIRFLIRLNSLFRFNFNIFSSHLSRSSPSLDMFDRLETWSQLSSTATKKYIFVFFF